MTKLMEWLAVLGTLFALWFTLVTKTFENNFTRDNEKLVLLSPFIAIIAFGLYSATVVLYRTFTFNNCEEAAEELRKEVVEARNDLKRLGFVFSEESG